MGILTGVEEYTLQSTREASTAYEDCPYGMHLAADMNAVVLKDLTPDSPAKRAGLVEGLHPGAAFLGELDLEEVSQSLRLECAVE